jgi:hypothetical protein
MHFHLSSANHVPEGKDTLRDQVAWVTAGLEENGHTTSFSESNIVRDNLNLLWEAFPTGMTRWLYDNGIAYGIIATEFADGAGFNNKRDETWRLRWVEFELAARNAKFIWCLDEGSVDIYSRYAPTAYLELGFTERLVPKKPRRKPRYDFSFAGLALDYRKTIIDALRERATVNYAGSIVDHSQQIGILRSGRIGLALKQSADWPWPSPARLGRLVHERIPIAAERTSIELGVSRLVPKPAENEDFVEWALARLDTNLEAEAERTFEAYRAMPMRESVARALDHTLARR